MLPLKNARISQEYGRINSAYKKGYHPGLDLVAGPNDKYAYVVSPGIILLSRQAPGKGYDPDGWGNYAIVRQDDGHDAIYAHLSRACATEGERVYPGDAIGIQGSTGNSSGAHLHFEIRKGDWQNCDDINPADYLGIKNELGPVEEKEKALEKITIRKEGEVYEGTLIDGVVYGPVRSLFESQGQEVIWNESTKTVTITTGPMEKLREIKSIVEGVR